MVDNDVFLQGLALQGLQGVILDSYE